MKRKKPKAKASPVIMVTSDGQAYIGPTPERIAKAIDEDGNSLLSEMTVDKTTNWRAMRITDSPIARMVHCKKPKLDNDQYQAGLAFYTVAYKSGLIASGVIDPAAIRVDGGQFKDVSDARIAAQTRYNHIIKAVDYDDLHVLDFIVVQETPLAEYAERFQRIPTRRERQAVALDRLRRALDKLAIHFAIKARPRGVNAYVGERPGILPIREDAA